MPPPIAMAGIESRCLQDRHEYPDRDGAAATTSDRHERLRRARHEIEREPEERHDQADRIVLRATVSGVSEKPVVSATIVA
jgi:hypothetical protein